MSQGKVPQRLYPIHIVLYIHWPYFFAAGNMFAELTKGNIFAELTRGNIFAELTEENLFAELRTLRSFQRSCTSAE